MLDAETTTILYLRDTLRLRFLTLSFQNLKGRMKAGYVDRTFVTAGRCSFTNILLEL